MHSLQFRIVGESLIPEDLTTLFNMQPKYSYKKGDEITCHRLDCEHPINATYSEGGWLTDIHFLDDQSIERDIEDFVVRFSPFSNQIKELVNGNKYYSTLWLTAEPEDVQLHFRISPDVISRLFDMGITFGVSIMSLQDIYAGRY